MLHYEPKNISFPEFHQLLLGGVGPRPIALVSTLSADGKSNLSPFSFFNAFGVNPPMIAFSPARRGKDASLKDTYNNLIATKECVVQSVTFTMIEQISLASTEYPTEIDEFIKSGLTPIDSDVVKPKMVKESPFQMECKLVEMKSYGESGGSSNIAICEVIKIHVSEDIFTNGIIDPQKIDLVGRMSGNYYCRANGEAIFEVEKPIAKKGIGYDQLPEFLKESHVFTANNLAKLANVESIPGEKSVTFYRYQRLSNCNYMMKSVVQFINENHPKANYFAELTAKCALENNETDYAWKAILTTEYFGS